MILVIFKPLGELGNPALDSPAYNRYKVEPFLNIKYAKFVLGNLNSEQRSFKDKSNTLVCKSNIFISELIVLLFQIS